MPGYETLTVKKFLDSAGTGTLWARIRSRYDSKLDNVVATNDSIAVTNNNSIAVKISTESDNALQVKTTGNKGLYVPASAAQDTYSIVQSEDSDYAAVYQLQKFVSGQGEGIPVGVAINIPKDMVVESGQVVTKETSGVWGQPGVYIELTLANAASSKLYIGVGDLIEYVTSGSSQGDMVVINIDNQHRVTATITDGTVTKAKLVTSVQNSLDLADSAVQNITEGSANGTISVDGTNVSVHGLGSAAYTNSNAYDAAGAAAAVLGTSSDLASTMTVYGVKQYASDVYASIQSLTNAEIDAAIVNANSSIDG